jgi:hypothetical protein
LLKFKSHVPAKFVLLDSDGKIVSETKTPDIDAPNDLMAKTAKITFSVTGIDLKDISLIIDQDESLEEITKMNNRVDL